MQSAGIARLLYPLEWGCATSLLSKLVGDWQLGERWWSALSDLDIASALYRCYESLTSSLWNEVRPFILPPMSCGVGSPQFY